MKAAIVLLPHRSPATDDGCGLSTQSRVTLTVVRGQQYMIRVGGFGDSSGPGLLTLQCGAESRCGADQGDCFVGNGSPYCDDASCCEAVCEVDQFCCDVTWDEQCAAEAEGHCRGAFTACAAGSGECDMAHEGPGCADESCCQTVCLAEPFCCLGEWDELCAEMAAQRCGALEACEGATGACDAAHASAGCENLSCCVDVCQRDSFCCTDGWDAQCAAMAAQCP
jgi:hypothetical protein